MLGVMVKQDQIPGGCLKDRRWDILTVYFPKVLALSSLLREGIRIVIAEEMASRNNAKRASIASQWIEIKRNLDVHRIFQPMPTI